MKIAATNIIKPVPINPFMNADRFILYPLVFI